jgi:23S rRNA (cytosine1962-C5)-methyltransferase
VKEARLVLKAGREKAVRHRHPWIFSGAVERIIGDPSPGDTLDIVDSKGVWLARAGYSPHSQIIARIWTWEKDQTIDRRFFKNALLPAASLRRPLKSYTDGYRMVHAENDGLPGIVADRYGGFLVVQFLSAAAERWKHELAGLFSEIEGIKGVYERSDADVRGKEGLAAVSGPLCGENPPENIILREGKWEFLVDVRAGHKTGFYLDQRDSRKAICEYVSAFVRGGEILNVFSYTGSFAVSSYAGGAGHVVNVDSSVSALDMARENIEHNGHTVGEDSFISANAFEQLRIFRDKKRLFDGVILDPPKFAVMQKDIRKATRAYKDINWLAMRIIRQNGLLFTFSCSGLVSEDLFQKVVFSSAIDAGREAQIIGRLGQPMDHPVRITFPEGRYLKGLVLRVL